MMSNAPTTTPHDRAEPAWEIARIFPPQGAWRDSDYLSVTNSTNQLVELIDHRVRVLPMPTFSHQLIVEFLYDLLRSFVREHSLGRPMFAPLRVRLKEGHFREPDIVFMLAEHAERMGERYWDGADLVMEIVSDDDESRRRDWDERRRDYAAAGVAEYWVVDPRVQRIVVLKLDGGRYVTHVEAHESGEVESALLQGFRVSTADVFAAAKH